MFRTKILALLLLTSCLHAQTPNSSSSADPDLTPLFAHIWRINSPTPYPNSGSIYIFLPDGTLFEGSCMETYRIATWKVDPSSPRTLVVTEDGSPAFTAAISELTHTTLRFEQNLLFAKERRDFSLAAVDKEFVCPDMPK
jgi:hypothetical protein